MMKRRSFLQGSLATLALPFLESALPRAARAAVGRRLTSSQLNRMVMFFIPNGLHPGAYFNDGTAQSINSGTTDFALTSVLQPLQPYRSSLLFMNGFQNAAAIVSMPGDHARGTGALLTCTQPVLNATATASISMDQVVANALASQYPIASLQVGTDAPNLSGQCDTGYSCTYTSVLAWANATTPLPNITGVANLFTRMFGTGGNSPLVLGQRNSILDYAAQDLQLLNGQLQSSDQQKLDAYLTSLRALEKQINFTLSCSSGGTPVDSAVFTTHVQKMIDTLVLGLQCNLAPVITFMLGNGQSNRVYDFINYNGSPISTGHHTLTHNGTGTDTLNQLALIENWEMQQLAYFISKLQSVPDTSGTLYDNTVLMVASEMAQGETHSHQNQPVILAGGTNAQRLFKPGQFLQVSGNGTMPFSNLYLTLMNAFTSVSQFGDSTGMLSLT